MIELLMVIIILFAISLLGITIFLWIQFNSTESRLNKLIENRIRLKNLYIDLDKLEPNIIEEYSQKQ